MRLHYKYTNYPLSPELTRKSEDTALRTHPLYGIVLGGAPAMLATFLFGQLPDALFMILLFGGAIAGPFLLAAYRRKKFAQYDAEYAKLLQSMHQ